MSKNFEFLKEHNKILYDLADSIEKQVYSAPSAVLCEATTFLDNLIDDIFKIKGITYDSHDTFYEKVDFLYNAKIIDNELKNYLLKTFKIRNGMHGKIHSAEDYLNGNKLRAVNIYKLLLNCSFKYISIFYDTNALKPTFLHPTEISKCDLPVESCIICGRKTSKDSIFCKNCNWEIEQHRDLQTIIKNIGYKNTFKKEDVLTLGFSKSYTNQLLLELQNQKLINATGKIFRFNKNEIQEFKEKIENYLEIEETINKFYELKIGFGEIKSSEIYIKGFENQDPYVEFFNLIFEESKNKFINEIKNKKNYQNLINNGILSSEEFIELFKDNWNNKDFDNLKIDITNKFLELKRLKKSKEHITKMLYIDEEIYDKLNNDKYIQEKLIATKKNQYIKSLIGGKSYPDALKINELSQKEVSEFLDKDKEFKKRYDTILEKRENLFLRLVETYGLKKAYKQSKLTKEQLKTAFKRKNNNQFYKELNKILMDKYLKQRKIGKSPKDAIEACEIDISIVNNWLNNSKFKNKLNNIKIELLISALNKDMQLTQGLKIANISKKDFDKYLLDAYNGNQEYSELLSLYKDKILQNQINKFFKVFEDKNEKKALKASKINKKIFELLLENDDEFKEKYLNFKKTKYVLKAVRNNHFKALRESGLTDKEYEENKDELKEELSILKELIELNNNSSIINVPEEFMDLLMEDIENDINLKKMLNEDL